MTTDGHFLTSRVPLNAGDAAAAIIVTEQGRYLLQLRDDLPQIWYPGHWGLFGGAIEPGENEIEALHRELLEELELQSPNIALFTGFEFDLNPEIRRRYVRNFYEVKVSEEAVSRLVLHEGADMKLMTAEEALSLPQLVPYDAFALFLYHHRGRIGR